MHFGRHYGSMDGEMQDLDVESLNKLVHGLRDIQEACYSMQLPSKALRAMARHKENKGGYFCPRGLVVPL
jgi:hypothetical protein